MHVSFQSLERIKYRLPGRTILHRSSLILWRILKNRIEITYESLVESQTHVSFQNFERIKYRLPGRMTLHRLSSIL